MAGSLYESAFNLLIFIAMCVAKLSFVEPWTPPPNAAVVDCHCEPPPPGTITCPPLMPPQAPESFPFPVPVVASPPPLPPAPDRYSPPPPWFSPPTIVYSSPPPPSVSSDTPCDIPSPPQQRRPWNGHPLPGLEFASAESLAKSALHTATLIAVIVLLIG